MMDWATLVDRSCTIAVLVLPAWVVWRLPSYFLSVPIGALMFWGWIAVDGLLLPTLDPEYDSIAPVFCLVFGWAIGGAYCCLLMGLCETVDPGRKSRSTSKISECAAAGNSALIKSLLGLVRHHN